MIRRPIALLVPALLLFMTRVAFGQQAPAAPAFELTTHVGMAGLSFAPPFVKVGVGLGVELGPGQYFEGQFNLNGSTSGRSMGEAPVTYLVGLKGDLYRMPSGRTKLFWTAAGGGMATSRSAIPPIAPLAGIGIQHQLVDGLALRADFRAGFGVVAASVGLTVPISRGRLGDASDYRPAPSPK